MALPAGETAGQGCSRDDFARVLKRIRRLFATCSDDVPVAVCRDGRNAFFYRIFVRDEIDVFSSGKTASFEKPRKRGPIFAKKKADEIEKGKKRATL
jgi:hypothetical protein